MHHQQALALLKISPMAVGANFSSLSSLVCVGTVGGIISSEMLDLNRLVEHFSSVELKPICFLEPVCAIEPVLSKKSVCSFFRNFPGLRHYIMWRCLMFLNRLIYLAKVGFLHNYEV